MNTHVLRQEGYDALVNFPLIDYMFGARLQLGPPTLIRLHMWPMSGLTQSTSLDRLFVVFIQR